MYYKTHWLLQRKVSLEVSLLNCRERQETTQVKLVEPKNKLTAAYNLIIYRQYILNQKLELESWLNFFCSNRVKKFPYIPLKPQVYVHHQTDETFSSCLLAHLC